MSDGIKSSVSSTPHNYTVPALHSSSSASSLSAISSASASPAIPSSTSSSSKVESPSFSYATPQEEALIVPRLCHFDSKGNAVPPGTPDSAFGWLIRNKLDVPVTLHCGIPKSDGSGAWETYQFPNGDNVQRLMPSGCLAVRAREKLLWLIQWTRKIQVDNVFIDQKYVAIFETQ